MIGFVAGRQRRKVARREEDLRASAPSDARGAEPDDDSAAVARYVADMTAQLESMASAARLDLLAYFLAMARLEAEEQAQTPANSDEARAP